MRPRRFGEDYVYGLDHRERFPRQYERMEHRFSMADRDWTEFCGYGYCRKPLMLVEMFRDKPGNGADLYDKGVTITRKLAIGVGAPAYVMAYLTERPAQVQAEIDQMNRQILDLTRRWPITRFRAQLLEPHRGPVETYEPDQWWELVALTHSEHHLNCRAAQRSGDKLANPSWVQAALKRHQNLWVPPRTLLWEA
jgi:hypothetical protein